MFKTKKELNTAEPIQASQTTTLFPSHLPLSPPTTYLTPNAIEDDRTKGGGEPGLCCNGTAHLVMTIVIIMADSLFVHKRRLPRIKENCSRHTTQRTLSILLCGAVCVCGVSNAEQCTRVGSSLHNRFGRNSVLEFRISRLSRRPDPGGRCMVLSQ